MTLDSRMLAATIRAHGGPDVLQLETLAVPVPSPGEVLLRVVATSLNYHDVFTRNGMPGITIPFPMVMGIDFAGEIAALGDGVSGWSPGQRVLVDPKDRVNGKDLMGETRFGGLAQYCSVPAHMLVALPDDVSCEQAACLPVAYGTAHRMMETIGSVRSGERVLVLGASGGVGTGCVQIAKAQGAEVIACASTPEKLERLRALGADHVLDYTQVELQQWVWSRFGKPHRRNNTGGLDVIVNFTGGGTWVPSLKCLRRQGRLLTCGATAGFDPVEDLRYIWTYELQIRGSNGWDRSDVESLLRMVGQESIAPPIDGMYSLAQAPAAMRRLEDRQAFGKVLVQPWQ